MTTKTTITRAAAALLVAAALGACSAGPDEADDAAPPASEPAPEPSAGPEALVGEWTLGMIDMADGDDVQPESDAVPMLIFTDEAEPTGSRRFAGSSGCNRIMGTYDAGSSGRLAVTRGPAMTMMACPEPVMRLEQIFLTAFESARSYEIDGDALSIDFGGGVIYMQRSVTDPN